MIPEWRRHFQIDNLNIDIFKLVIKKLIEYNDTKRMIASLKGKYLINTQRSE